MKNFIEITDKEDSKKTLVAINKILDVTIDNDGSTFIALGADNDGIPYGINTVETYEQIKQLLILAR